MITCKSKVQVDVQVGLECGELLDARHVIRFRPIENCISAGGSCLHLIYRYPYRIYDLSVTKRGELIGHYCFLGSSLINTLLAKIFGRFISGG